MSHVQARFPRWTSSAVAIASVVVIILSSANCRPLSAQVTTMPMPTADSGRPATQDSQMRMMMGAPLPFGIMIGRAEQWMAGYQIMNDRMSGLLEGTNSVSEARVLSRFATTPTDMTMRTHMGMLMYAPTARFTAMAMVPYVTMSMGELHRDGTRSTERSNGSGDVELRGLYSVRPGADMRHRILADFGVALPTGSVNQRDAEGNRTEYPMQTGSGTYSLLPGIIYLGQTLPWSWGAELTSTVRMGTNEHGYRLGNTYDPGVWLARSLSGLVSVSAGATGEVRESIHGSDALLDPTDEPTKDARLQGGKRVDASIGVTLTPRRRILKGQQVLAQFDVPVAESLDGPQLKHSYMLHVAWQWAW